MQVIGEKSESEPWHRLGVYVDLLYHIPAIEKPQQVHREILSGLPRRKAVSPTATTVSTHFKKKWGAEILVFKAQ